MIRCISIGVFLAACEREGGHTTSSAWVVEAGGVVESSDFAGAELVHSRIVERDYQIVVDTVPEVRIGTETGDSPGFGNVSGLAVDRLGNFFVADGAYLEVGSFSSVICGPKADKAPFSVPVVMGVW